MKLIIITFLLLSSFQLSSQTVNELMQKAASFKDNPDSTYLNYHKAIMLVLEDKELVNDTKWHELLMSAAASRSKASLKLPSHNYFAMDKGSPGENLAEKIDFLKQYGVIDMVIYYGYGGQTRNHIIDGCSINENRFLLWSHKNKTYVQQFNECRTYKPLITGDSTFGEFYKSNKDVMADEKLLELPRKSHGDMFELTFISSGTKHSMIKINGYDLVEPRSDQKVIAKYKRNMETKLAQFLPIIITEVTKYRKVLSSGAERIKIGMGSSDLYIRR